MNVCLIIFKSSISTKNATIWKFRKILWNTSFYYLTTKRKKETWTSTARNRDNRQTVGPCAVRSDWAQTEPFKERRMHKCSVNLPEPEPPGVPLLLHNTIGLRDLTLTSLRLEEEALAIELADDGVGGGGGGAEMKWRIFGLSWSPEKLHVVAIFHPVSVSVWCSGDWRVQEKSTAKKNKIKSELI